MLKNPRTYKRSDFERGDFILIEYATDCFIKGEILELGQKTAKIEVALPTKKSEPLDIDVFDVDYHDIIPIAAVLSKNSTTVEES